MDPRVEMYKAAFGQGGNGFDFPIYHGRSQFGQGFDFSVYRGRGQRGKGIGDLLRGIVRFFRPVARTGLKTLLTAGSEAIKDGASVKDILSNTLKPIISSILTSTAEQVSNMLLADKPATAPPPAPEIGLPAGTLINSAPQTGTEKRRSVYKPRSHKSKRIARHYTPFVQFLKRLNF